LENLGFNLRKWISNVSEIVEASESTEENKILETRENESIKTLGLQWEPIEVEFKFKFVQVSIVNKRMESTHAKMYDP